jgi:hypothetical protein
MCCGCIDDYCYTVCAAVYSLIDLAHNRLMVECVSVTRYGCRMTRGGAGQGWGGLFAALSQMYIHKSGQMLANPSCTDACACMRSLMHMLSITQHNQHSFCSLRSAGGEGL